MKEIWNGTQIVFTVIGGYLGYFLGGTDGFLYALIIFVVCDYVTGVLVAVSKKDVSSEVGFKGIAKKVFIFILVGIANIVDKQILGNGNAIRTAVIFFYLSNEGISILENSSLIGLPVPQKLQDVLEQLKDHGEEKDHE